MISDAQRLLVLLMSNHCMTMDYGIRRLIYITWKPGLLSYALLSYFVSTPKKTTRAVLTTPELGTTIIERKS
jgi:hypothetical protein